MVEDSLSSEASLPASDGCASARPPLCTHCARPRCRCVHTCTCWIPLRLLSSGSERWTQHVGDRSGLAVSAQSRAAGYHLQVVGRAGAGPIACEQQQRWQSPAWDSCQVSAHPGPWIEVAAIHWVCHGSAFNNSGRGGCFSKRHRSARALPRSAHSVDHSSAAPRLSCPPT